MAIEVKGWDGLPRATLNGDGFRLLSIRQPNDFDPNEYSKYGISLLLASRGKYRFPRKAEFCYSMNDGFESSFSMEIDEVIHEYFDEDYQAEVYRIDFCLTSLISIVEVEVV